MLRVSEAVVVNVSGVREKTLLVGRSKTDQEGEGVDLYITRDTRKAIRWGDIGRRIVPQDTQGG